MERLFLPLAAAALIFPLAYLAVPPALAAWRRRRDPKRKYPGRLRNMDFREPVLVIPPADETAAVVERFHEAVRRSDLSDFLRPGA
jgi:hypothetical protein